LGLVYEGGGAREGVVDFADKGGVGEGFTAELGSIRSVYRRVDGDGEGEGRYLGGKRAGEVLEFSELIADIELAVFVKQH
jgi:hypothetical protein